MIRRNTYIKNLMVANYFRHIDGAVVECGTWRGGMIGGIAKTFSDNRKYFLFDSFEGLPEAKPIDGTLALNWQKNKLSYNYYDNCKADEAIAKECMDLSGVKNVFIQKGWFRDTLPSFNKDERIAILRLDGDWYESTMECLVHLYANVVEGGVIILDDYYTWEGCAKAVHDFLSRNNLNLRIRQWSNNVCYFIKQNK